MSKKFTPKHILIYMIAVVTATTSLLHSPASAFTSTPQYRMDNDVLWTNPDAVGCMGSGGGSEGDIEASEAAEAIFKFFTSTPFYFNDRKPLTALQAAAFMGNFYQESRYNPAIIQGGKAYNEARALNPGVGGYAFGLVQWDGGRRVELVKFAKEQNKDWRDITLQFDFIKSELNGSERRILTDAEFRSTTDIAKATVLVRKLYERPGAPHDANRIAAAKKAYNTYKSLTPDPVIPDGERSGPPTCDTGVTPGNGDIAKTAMRLSWPTRCKEGKKCDHGATQANPAYAAALKQVGTETCSDNRQKIGASCDAFLYTVLHFAGIVSKEDKFPCGASGNQDDYMRKHTEMFTYIGTYSAGAEKTLIESKKIQPGDIMARNGHVSIYIGDGREADASIGGRTAEQDVFYLDGTYNIYRAKQRASTL